jgi:hypothetical protein
VNFQVNVAVLLDSFVAASMRLENEQNAKKMEV